MVRRFGFPAALGSGRDGSERAGGGTGIADNGRCRVTFVVLLFVMIALAWFFPEPGAMQGPYSPHAIANYLVSVIFLVYGIGLSPRQFRDGLMNWRLHLVVHLSTFLLFPLIALVGMSLCATEQTHLLWLGVFYLAVLPSTVSSSVVMVSLAGGNMPAAIFNASLSGVIGIFLTPLWMSLFASAGPGGFDPLRAIGSLALLVLLPIVLGMLLHRRLGDWVTRHRATLRLFDQSVILLIVFCSFGESFASHAFEGLPALTLPILTIGMIALFFLVYGLIDFVCHRLHFNREDTITALFCGSKKSLMHGTVMANILLVGLGGVGVILLPLMLYHALQLILVAVIVARWRQVSKNETLD